MFSVKIYLIYFTFFPLRSPFRANHLKTYLHIYVTVMLHEHNQKQVCSNLCLDVFVYEQQFTVKVD